MTQGLHDVPKVRKIKPDGIDGIWTRKRLQIRQSKPTLLPIFTRSRSLVHRFRRSSASEHHITAVLVSTIPYRHFLQRRQGRQFRFLRPLRHSALYRAPYTCHRSDKRRKTSPRGNSKENSQPSAQFNRTEFSATNPATTQHRLVPRG
jgi:hypothetical protein